MFKYLIAPAMLGITLFTTGHILVNADEIMRENCLENATCYKTDSLK